MGDPNYFRLVPASCATVPIDWSKVPEASKQFLLESWGLDWETNQKRPLPVSIEDFVKMVDETRFFGYMGTQLCTLLLDISEFGLEASLSTEIGPRFYMRYLDEIWFILFMPGERDTVIGYSPEVVSFDEELKKEWEKYEGKGEGEGKWKGEDEDEDEFSRRSREDDEDDKRSREKEKALAEAYDLKLCREFNPWTSYVEALSTKRMSEWKVEMLSCSLVTAHKVEVMLSRPAGYPGRSAFLHNLLHSSLNRHS